LQTPRLWTDLIVNVLGLTHDLYDLYLHRSKLCLLDITLDCFFTSSRDASDCAKRHLERLIPHVGRWRKLIVRSGYIGSRLSALSHLCAPALETLVLDFITNQPPEIELFSGGAPRLSSLELIGAIFRPPLGAVKHLKLSRASYALLPSYDQLSRLIEPIRSLTHLSIAAKIAREAGNHPPIELPSVLVLDIYFNHRTDSSALRILDFPAVESLTIHGDTDVVIEALTRHHRVYPHVQSLTLANSSEYGDTENTSIALALDFVSLLPAVRDVVFQGTNPSPISGQIYLRSLSWLQEERKLCKKSKYGPALSKSSKIGFSLDIRSRASSCRRRL
jgi:hypothetical protein